MPNQHIVPHKGNWAVRAENASRITAEFSTQEKAFDFGRDIAQNQGKELFLHGRDGKIRERNSYGSDPYPPKG
ncbi:MAG: DUF2188 domain-containing protein [Candidatus Magasanikiibacteriota bacterium]